MNDDLTHKLRRYTTLPILINMLQRRQITFVDPSTWDDFNDSRFLAIYKERKEMKTVLALCFTRAKETYHHWRVFSQGSGGVCVTFHRAHLLNALGNRGTIRCGYVQYKNIRTLKRNRPLVEDLPFLKRMPYKPECEFRAIYESAADEKHFVHIPIELSSIERITLSPWLRKDLTKGVRDLLREISGHSSMVIARSTLISNEEWQEYGEASTS